MTDIWICYTTLLNIFWMKSMNDRKVMFWTDPFQVVIIQLIVIIRWSGSGCYDRLRSWIRACRKSRIRPKYAVPDPLCMNNSINCNSRLEWKRTSYFTATVVEINSIVPLLQARKRPGGGFHHQIPKSWRNCVYHLAVKNVAVRTEICKNWEKKFAKSWFILV